jgi:hypothetical protein
MKRKTYKINSKHKGDLPGALDENDTDDSDHEQDSYNLNPVLFAQ